MKYELYVDISMMQKGIFQYLFYFNVVDTKKCQRLYYSEASDKIKYKKMFKNACKRKINKIMVDRLICIFILLRRQKAT